MIVKLALDEKREEKLGNKGKFLLQMKKEGFTVPGGFRGRLPGEIPGGSAGGGRIARRAAGAI